MLLMESKSRKKCPAVEGSSVGKEPAKAPGWLIEFLIGRVGRKEAVEAGEGWSFTLARINPSFPPRAA
jgi:hypothetical protein